MVPRRRQKPRELPRLEAEIERLSLAEHVRELDDQGLCIVPPERTGFGPDFVDRGRKALLAVAEKRTATRTRSRRRCTRTRVRPRRGPYAHLTSRT